eukprot:CAMPEP_0168523202 /NCGR_PEP_ID=MMETSP0405-20121227/9832_1 /TAXON_ID=498012 /ORGANISM="Trichosphaerium sp, Strain Am-I-7 wt" /LENGTH=199 /DNA_ID=CAMNT_0008545009 /DNA_START=14 /DNA_END=613 /DNA_ORIENTATION=+
MDITAVTNQVALKLGRAIMLQTVFSFVIHVMALATASICTELNMYLIAWYLLLIFGQIVARKRSVCLLVVNAVIQLSLNILILMGIGYAVFAFGTSVKATHKPFVFHYWKLYVNVFAFVMVIVSQWLNIKHSCLLARLIIQKAKEEEEVEAQWEDIEASSSSEEEYEESEVPMQPVMYVMQPPTGHYAPQMLYPLQPVN